MKRPRDDDEANRSNVIADMGSGVFQHLAMQLDTTSFARLARCCKTANMWCRTFVDGLDARGLAAKVAYTLANAYNEINPNEGWIAACVTSAMKSTFSHHHRDDKLYEQGVYTCYNDYYDTKGDIHEEYILQAIGAVVTDWSQPSDYHREDDETDGDDDGLLLFTRAIKRRMRAYEAPSTRHSYAAYDPLLTLAVDEDALCKKMAEQMRECLASDAEDDKEECDARRCDRCEEYGSDGDDCCEKCLWGEECSYADGEVVTTKLNERALADDDWCESCRDAYDRLRREARLAYLELTTAYRRIRMVMAFKRYQHDRWFYVGCDRGWTTFRSNLVHKLALFESGITQPKVILLSSMTISRVMLDTESYEVAALAVPEDDSDADRDNDDDDITEVMEYRGDDDDQ